MLLFDELRRLIINSGNPGQTGPFDEAGRLLVTDSHRPASTAPAGRGAPATLATVTVPTNVVNGGTITIPLSSPMVPGQLIEIIIQDGSLDPDLAGGPLIPAATILSILRPVTATPTEAGTRRRLPQLRDTQRRQLRELEDRFLTCRPLRRQSRRIDTRTRTLPLDNLQQRRPSSTRVRTLRPPALQLTNPQAGPNPPTSTKEPR